MMVVWTLQKIIDVLRRRFKNLDKELKVYENMTGENRQLDTNELMKIISFSYINLDDEEVDIDSNLNLQDAIRYNRKIRDPGYLPVTSPYRE